MALTADATLYTDHPAAGRAGLEAARAIAMLSYRSYQTYQKSQGEFMQEKLDNFRASSYQRYQGEKLWKRFDPLAYLALAKAMDSHNVGRGRNGVSAALRQIKAATLVVGIQSDLLFPIEEQILLADQIPNAFLTIIDSIYGHDGFLVEARVITEKLEQFLKGEMRSKRIVAVPGLPGTETF